MPARRAAPSSTLPPKAARSRRRDRPGTTCWPRSPNASANSPRRANSRRPPRRCSARSASPSPIRRRCSRPYWTRASGCSAAKKSASTRSATTRWCGSAWRGPSAEEALRDVTPVGESVTGRIVRERRMHHIPDLVAEPGLSPTVRERAERLGSASLLYAPMLCGGPRTRLDPRRALAAETVLGAGACASAKLRRSGGDRDPERPALQ